MAANNKNNRRAAGNLIFIKYSKNIIAKIDKNIRKKAVVCGSGLISSNKMRIIILRTLDLGEWKTIRCTKKPFLSKGFLNYDENGIL